MKFVKRNLKRTKSRKQLERRVRPGGKSVKPTLAQKEQTTTYEQWTTHSTTTSPVSPTTNSLSTIHDARDLITSRKPQNFPKLVFSEDTAQKHIQKGKEKTASLPAGQAARTLVTQKPPLKRPKQSQNKYKRGQRIKKPQHRRQRYRRTTICNRKR